VTGVLSEMAKVPHPFVKWAGGKARVARHVLLRLPAKIGTYYEPLVGGGAVLFELMQAGRAERAVIADLNPDLMNAWRVIKQDVGGLVKELRRDRYRYDEDTFLKIREMDRKPSFARTGDLRRAARFVYLNRTCFNGLYRVNADGHFNAPFGKYANPVICDEVNLRAVSEVLQKCEVLTADFDEAVGGAGRGDAVYFDPPYIPISKTSSFTGYTPGGFGVEDHRRLAGTFARLAKRGVRVVLSNSAAPEAEELYRQFDMDWIMGGRSVGGPAEYRKKAVKEMIAFAGPRT
jgi:DNA adenine methylase